MRTAKRTSELGQATAKGRPGGEKRLLPAAAAREGTLPRTLEAKVVPIGNSRGIRLPKDVLAKYAIGDAVLLEEREEGLLLRSKDDDRLSWEDTFKEMAREREDWSDLDKTVGDGLDKEPW
jgi:antitoxin MazE